MPAMRGAAGGAAPVEQRHQPQPVGVPAVARAAPNRISSASAPSWSTSRPSPSSSQAHAEPVEVLGGQVDPAVEQVLADVPQDVGLLQGDAERVGVARRASGSGRLPKTPRQSRPTTPATQRQ